MVMDVSRIQNCHGHSETHSPTHAHTHTHTISSIIMIEHVSSPPRRGTAMFSMPLAGACNIFSPMRAHTYVLHASCWGMQHLFAHAGTHICLHASCWGMQHILPMRAHRRPRGHTHMLCMPLAGACSAHAGNHICQDLQAQGQFSIPLLGH